MAERKDVDVVSDVATIATLLGGYRGMMYDAAMLHEIAADQFPKGRILKRESLL
jgi:hypothetical protein